MVHVNTLDVQDTMYITYQKGNIEVRMEPLQTAAMIIRKKKKKKKNSSVDSVDFFRKISWFQDLLIVQRSSLLIAGRVSIKIHGLKKKKTSLKS